MVGGTIGVNGLIFHPPETIQPSLETKSLHKTPQPLQETIQDPRLDPHLTPVARRALDHACIARLSPASWYPRRPMKTRAFEGWIRF